MIILFLLIAGNAFILNLVLPWWSVVLPGLFLVTECMKPNPGFWNWFLAVFLVGRACPVYTYCKCWCFKCAYCRTIWLDAGLDSNCYYSSNWGYIERLCYPNKFTVSSK